VPPPVQQRQGRWTAADIGGTHARLARWTATAGLEAPLRLRNDDFGTPVDLLEHWFHRFDDEPRRVVLALAMPLGSETLRLTNRAWRFDPRELVDALRLQSLVIVNDFAAAAAGVDALAPDAVSALNREGTPVVGTRLVLGPGTGLGTAAIVADDPPRIVPSEAGHITFGSAEGIADRVNAEGRARWGRVSWERVLCGAGLAWLHELQCGRAVEAEAIAQAAAAGEAAALESVRLFARLLGEFAGDMCLAFQAMEGVYLCGGVLKGLRPVFDAPAFLAAFSAKGRFSALLQRVPVHYAAGHELGMQGAARFLAGRCRMPSMEWHA
jgi:glucokinase